MSMPHSQDVSFYGVFSGNVNVSIDAIMAGMWFVLAVLIVLE